MHDDLYARALVLDSGNSRIAIVALDLVGSQAGYLSELGPRLRAAAVDRGALLRPLGNVLYAMPPACTTAEEARQLAGILRELVELT